MPGSPGRLKRFGLFELDLDARQLRRQGVRVRLQEQPFQVLVALVEHPGDIITRERLRERLWPADRFVDFDHSLNTAIAKLRQALGDAAESPRFIETLAKHGYRFIAPVVEAASDVAPAASAAAADPTNSAASVETTPALLVPARLTGRRLTLVAVTLAVAAAAIAGPPSFNVIKRFVTGTRSSAPADLAILPIRVLTSDLDKSIGIRLTDAVITHLANERALKLRPTAAVLRYENLSDPLAAARELDVAHVVVGTLQKRRSGYRVSVQLIRRADGLAMWGRSYDSPSGEEGPSADDAIAQRLARGVAAGFAAAGQPPRRDRATFDSDDLYFQGRTLMLNYSEANIRAAVDAFARALQIDPHDAVVRSELSIALAWFSRRYANETEAASWGRRADMEANLALAQDPSLPEAHLARAYAASTPHLGVNWPLVLSEADMALALDPTLALAHAARAEAFYHLGLFDLVQAELSAAFRLETQSSVEMERLQLAAALFSGRFAHVTNAAERVRARTDAPAIPTYLGTALFYLGQRERAEDLLSSISRDDSPHLGSQAALAGVLAANGKHAEARAMVRRTVSGPYMDHHVAYSVGATLAQLGDPQEAVRWLRRAADDGFPCYPWFRDDSLLAPIRQDVTFRAFLEDLRVRFEEARRRYSRDVS